MKAWCYDCKCRMNGTCKAKEEDFERESKGSSLCPKYSQALVRDVIKDDNEECEIFDEYTHRLIEECDGKTAKEKYGNRLFYSGYYKSIFIGKEED